MAYSRTNTALRHFSAELLFSVWFLTDKGHFNKEDIEVKECKEVRDKTEKESIGSSYVYQEELGKM